MTTSDDIDIVRNDEGGRYEIRVDGDRAGYTTFEPDETGHLVFAHTVVDPKFSGRGLGTTLVAEALADTARRGDVVVPRCPFVVGYLKDHDVPGLLVNWPDEDDASGSAAPAEPA